MPEEEETKEESKREPEVMEEETKAEPEVEEAKEEEEEEEGWRAACGIPRRASRGSLQPSSRTVARRRTTGPTAVSRSPHRPPPECWVVVAGLADCAKYTRAKDVALVGLCSVWSSTWSLVSRYADPC